MLLARLLSVLAFATVAVVAFVVADVSVTVTTTITTTVGLNSTSYVFRPNNPPATKRHLGIDGHGNAELTARNAEPVPALNARATSTLVCNQDNCLRALERFSTDAAPFCSTYTTTTDTATDDLPTFIPTACGPSSVSSACSCFQVANTATTTFQVQTVTVTDTATVTAETVTTTIYPCKTPMHIPSIAIGVAETQLSDLGPLTTVNVSLNSVDTINACCDACFFHYQNCVQAYWHDQDAIDVQQPLGCIVHLYPDAVGDGATEPAHVTKNCPNGIIDNLWYGVVDGSAYYMAGGCGYEYDNVDD